MGNASCLCLSENKCFDGYIYNDGNNNANKGESKSKKI